MANQGHVERLQHSIDDWNRWRRENHWTIRPNLDEANLSKFDLSEANLFAAHLSGADLSKTNLGGANLGGANLSGANLSGANLSGANLNKVDLSNAGLLEANLNGANLSGASLSGANLSGANLSRANLSGANLSRVILNNTIFTKVNLSNTIGLIAIHHKGPSDVELVSVQLPQDGSALHFLRGVGIPDEWIDFWKATMMHPIQYHSCFISYSSKDEMLATRLHADLQAKGVRCWFAPEHLKIGDKLRNRIDEAIHLQDKLLLLLSSESIKSGWVDYEVEVALAREREQQREILFPIRLDETILASTSGWAATLRQTRHIGDFTKWSTAQDYQKAFEQLLHGLKQDE